MSHTKVIISKFRMTGGRVTIGDAVTTMATAMVAELIMVVGATAIYLCAAPLEIQISYEPLNHLFRNPISTK